MRVLFLSTWLPYPPNQGSKIRAYHLLRALSDRHDVGLISFQDGEVKHEWLDHLGELCSSVQVITREPFVQSRLGALLGWFSSQPRSVVGSFSPEMAVAVEAKTVRWKPDIIMALTFVAVSYARKLQAQLKIADVDNLLAHMLFEEYQQSRHLLSKMRRYIAYLKFKQYERELYRPFDMNLVTSGYDAQRIRKYIPLEKEQVCVVPNGVDLEFFKPGLFEKRTNAMVFNGSITYAPNYDAMEYFLSDIFPAIKREVPEAKIAITGSTDGIKMDSLPSGSSIRFTGYVEDIREVVARSTLCVVPLRKGAGTRLKILEAMALGVPVISTSKGAEGLEVERGRHLLIADDPIDFAASCIRLLHDRTEAGRIASEASRLVREKYGWGKIRADFLSNVERRIHGQTP